MDSLNIGTVIVGHELSRYANWKESSCTDVGKFCMVSALPREVDRSKHHSVYRGERDRVDAYARPRWWCCSPHQLTLLLPLFKYQFSGASNQLRIKHLSSGLRATIYQHYVPSKTGALGTLKGFLPKLSPVSFITPAPGIKVFPLAT